jgi:hypothetical protein
MTTRAAPAVGTPPQAPGSTALADSPRPRRGSRPSPSGGCAVGPTVLAGPILWDVADSPRVLRFYRDWISDAPDELTTVVIHRQVAAIPAMPVELHGRRVVMVVGCYVGDLDEGDRVVRPLRNFGAPLLDLWKPKPFVAHQAMFDPSFPHGRWSYFRSCNIAQLTDQIIDLVAANGTRIASPHSAFPIFQLGGAISRVADDDTAYGGRTAAYTVTSTGSQKTPLALMRNASGCATFGPSWSRSRSARTSTS